MPDPIEEPVFSDAMEDLWNRIPAIYRDEDVKRGWKFKRWLAAPMDIVGGIEVLLQRIEYLNIVGDTSDLADSMAADPEWLPWISMLRGTLLPASATEEQKRLLLQTDSYTAGTKASIKAVVQSTLTGSKFCQVYDHTSDNTAKGAATEWDMLVVTRSTEATPGYGDAALTVVRAGVKPAGVRMYHRYADATSWSTIEAEYPTWAAWDAAGSWAAIETADGL